MIFQVPEGSQAVILRFGIEQKPRGPGLHWKLPSLIEKKIIVSTSDDRELRFGATTKQGRRRTSEEADVSDMLTGDLNVVEIAWTVRYRISNPGEFLFNVRQPEETLRDLSESVMREIVGDRTVDEVVTTGRGEILVEATQDLKALVDKYEMGIFISGIQFDDVQLPGKVLSAVEDVEKARQEKETKIYQASEERERKIPAARGEAQKQLSEAEGYAAERINKAKGDTARFVALFNEYEKAPEVTKRRIYLETMQEVVPRFGKSVVIDEEANQVLPLLNLNSQD